jgi:plastocyanin
MSLPHRAAAVAAVLFCVLLTPVSSPASAANGGPPAITLYGDGGRGWGLNSTSIKSPGPTLTVLLGYPVTIDLVGMEPAVQHNWFIDYNGNNLTDPGEPKSPDFIGAGPTPFTFVPDREGNWTYKCAYHFMKMFGKIQVVPRTNVTLYADAGLGWGDTNKTIRSPGPPLVFLAGTNVTLTLIAAATDNSRSHDFFIDYNGDQLPSVGEPKTADFNNTNSLTTKIHLDRAGNFTYYCEYHSHLMHGNVLVLGVLVPAGGGFNVALIPGIMLIALGGVLIFAAVYHVRAVRAVKSAK